MSSQRNWLLLAGDPYEPPALSHTPFPVISTTSLDKNQTTCATSLGKDPGRENKGSAVS